MPSLWLQPAPLQRQPVAVAAQGLCKPSILLIPGVCLGVKVVRREGVGRLWVKSEQSTVGAWVSPPAASPHFVTHSVSASNTLINRLNTQHSQHTTNQHISTHPSCYHTGPPHLSQPFGLTSSTVGPPLSRAMAKRRKLRGRQLVVCSGRNGVGFVEVRERCRVCGGGGEGRGGAD